MIAGPRGAASLDVPLRSEIPPQSPFRLGEWVRFHGRPGNPRGPRRWGWRGYVTGSLGATILTGFTDDGFGWAEYWGALSPDVPTAAWPWCTCCPRRTTPERAARPAQLDLFATPS